MCCQVNYPVMKATWMFSGINLTRGKMKNRIFPVTTSLNAIGGLQIANLDLSGLAKQYGTPLYVYDAQTVRLQVETLQGLLRQHYPGAFEIAYASKAYLSLGFARHLAQLGLGVDVVSRGELVIAQKAGFLAERVHLHGNNKSIEELNAAVGLGVQAIVVDSLEELQFVEQIAAVQQKETRVWLRITPGLTVDTHPYRQTAHPASKFGLPIEGGSAAEGIRTALSSRWLRLTGLHTHLGSQFFEAEPFQRAIHMLMELAEQQNFIPAELSPGGGWGVPYTEEDDPGDPRAWVETVCQAVQMECSQRHWPLPKLILEPGRWIAARAGVAIYSVGTTKAGAEGHYFVSVDGGLADNPRPALYQARYTACLVDRPDAPPVRKVTIVGKFCESGDQLIPEIDLPEVQRGDLLVMPVAGAYQLSMSSNYNLAARPAALWLDAGHVEVLQKREHPEQSGYWLGD
jgi:diaminopimelate decarboxylase